jgi:DNA mismatch repair ATPase MutS
MIQLDHYRAGKIYRLYTGFKRHHPDLLCFFSRGKTYEAYYGDAKAVSGQLGEPLLEFEGIPVFSVAASEADAVFHRLTRAQFHVGLFERDPEA